MKVVLNREKLYLQMNQSLHRKYEYLFHFFQVKWINELLDGSHRGEGYQDFADMRMDVQDVQFLKRYYHHKTPTGKVEIDNRLRLCIEFYANNIAFMYEYPMMVVTNTRSLFVRRNKRVKKIRAGEGSSDETEQQQGNEMVEEHSSNFLEEVDRSCIEEEDESIRSDLSLESEGFDIYQQFSEQAKTRQEFYRMPRLNQINEVQVSHLITDVGASSSTLKLQSQGPSTSKQTLNNIQNQPKSSKQSILSVVPIEQKLSIGSKDKRSRILSSYLDFMLDKQVSYTGLGFKFDNPAVNEYSSQQQLSDPRKTPGQSIQKQREQRASRRQKIREKAQQLLKRVSKDDEIQQRY